MTWFPQTSRASAKSASRVLRSIFCLCLPVWFCLCCWLWPPYSFAKPTGSAQLAVWNVGQGQWATWIEKDACFHFDIGGEFAPLEKIREACRDRDNFALFSHWDWDHVGMVRRAARNLSRFCVLKSPAGPSSAKARALFVGIPECLSNEPKRIRLDLVHELTRPSTGGVRSNDRSVKNTASRVFELSSRVLIPGDSPTTQERRWLHFLRTPRSIRLLLVGHHGSRTSTSQELLAQLKGLKQAIASARKERYGHPHAPVVKRLKLKGVALLRTDEWGTIRVEVRH